jgi:excisionase family DNA binding protein
MTTKYHPAVAAAQGQPERLLRTDQAALRLKCTPRTVTNLCNQKLLAGIKSGRRKWLIPESAIRDYLSALNEDQEELDKPPLYGED